jgi:hypothetical protein
MSSPRALPLPDDPDAPMHWRREPSGILAEAIAHYRESPLSLTVREVAHIRGYLSQWIMSVYWDDRPDQTGRSKFALENLRHGVGAIACAPDIRAWLRAAADAGMTPL